MDWVKRVLTRKCTRRGPRGRVEEFEVSPRDELVYGVKFAISMTACLTAVEVGSIAFLHVWNGEVFASITGLIGLVTGILVGHHA